MRSVAAVNTNWTPLSFYQSCCPYTTSDCLMLEYMCPLENGDYGQAKTLRSKTKKCTMLFPVKVTKNTANRKRRDTSYGKSSNSNGIVKTL